MKDEGYFNEKTFSSMEEAKKHKNNIHLLWKTKDFLTITSFSPWKTIQKTRNNPCLPWKTLKKETKTFIWRFPNRSAKSWWCLTP